MSDFVLIFSSLYCWLFDDSDLVLGCASEKDKNNSVKLVLWEIKYLTTFMTVFDL